MAAYEDRFVAAADGVRLHLRDHPGGGKPPILCLSGLTRSVRDYAGVAERLASEWRVVAMDFRGRGESGRAEGSSCRACAGIHFRMRRSIDHPATSSGSARIGPAGQAGVDAGTRPA